MLFMLAPAFFKISLILFSSILATFRLSLFIDPSDINVTGIVLSGI
jgi:hypothetical protein